MVAGQRFNRSGDTDFAEDRLRRRYTEDLANTVGNLINRVVVIIRRSFGGVLPDPVTEPRPELDDVQRAAGELPAVVDHQLERFDLRRAAAAVIEVAASTNQAIEATRPWDLARSDRPEDRARLAAICRDLVIVCRSVATELGPFIPDGAARLHAALGTGTTVGDPLPAFPRLPVAHDTPPVSGDY